MANAASKKPAAAKPTTPIVDDPTERERAVVAREAELEERESKLDTRERELEEKETEATERAAELDEREQNADALATATYKRTDEPFDGAFGLLPEPSEGNGYVVTEAPLPLVTVMAHLHPSDRKSVGEQIAGAMTQVLVETGKWRSNRAIAELEPAEFAVLGEHGLPRVDEPADE